MHTEARAFVEQQVARYGPFPSVIEIGSRDINGGVRDLFGGSHYVGVDIAEGPGVDVICDAAKWLPEGPYAALVSAEVFEHAAQWDQIIHQGFSVLAPAGYFILTMAGEGRGPHSGIDGGELHPGEHYANIGAEELGEALVSAGANWFDTDVSNPGDLYAVGQKEA